MLSHFTAILPSPGLHRNHSPMKQLFVTLFSLLFIVPQLARGETRAVLVGVGDYLYLDADLKGPLNDVGLMAETLMLRGVAAAQITVLADEIAETPAGVARALPDRTTILSTLNDTLAASATGDTLVFYFSGHGAQAPDDDGDEGGGMDEIFLPRDTRGWNGGIGAVENAIRDDEFAAFTTLAAARGVKLVAILDACHSGTGFRALDTGAARARYISPATLGLPETDGTLHEAETPPPEGEYVFLYAAQSDQRAFEYPVGEERRWHGDFTRAITAVLREEPNLSYSTLVQATARRIETRAGQAAQTPDVEGPMADTPVLGGDAPGLSRITVDGQTLKAGLLSDITQGSEVTLYGGLLDKAPAGRAIVTEVHANSADLRYLEPFPTTRVSHAEVTRRAVDVSFSLAFTPDAASQLARNAEGGTDALQKLLDIDVSASDPTHLVIWTGKEFALIGPDGVLDANGPGASPRLGDGPAADLAARLSAVAGRIRFERALAQLGQGGAVSGFSLGPSGPKVAFGVIPGTQRAGRCRAGNGAPQPANASANARHCDILNLRIDNPTASMQDITVLYIDAASQISTLWPTQNVSNRLESGGSKSLRFGLRNDSARPLHESVIVLSVPAEPGSLRTRFTGLGTGGKTRGNNGPMANYLADLTEPATSRNFSLTPNAPALSVARLDLNVQPLAVTNN